MNKTFKRLTKAIAFVLTLIICLQAVPITSGAASTHDYTSVKSLINNAKLYPQKTGFVQMDKKVESMLKEFKKKSSTTFDLVVAAYDWLVYNVKYDDNYSYYKWYDFDLKTKSPVPFYAVYFGYDPLFCNEGVCDSINSAFVIMARAIGLDAYLRYGIQVTSGATYTHMWAEIIFDGVGYVFDPQSDNSVYHSRGTNSHMFFGLPASGSSMYRIQNGRVNASKLFAAFTPVSKTLPVSYYSIKFSAVGNGTVSPSGQTTQESAQMTARSNMFVSKDYSYNFSGWLEGTNIASAGATVTLVAKADSGATFYGWYVNNKLVSTAPKYSFKASQDVNAQALFSGASFIDVPEGKWYYEAVYFCFKRSLMTGTTLVNFSPESNLTRAMAVTVLAKMAGADLSGYTGKTSFKDVPKGKWYSAPVQWASKNGLVSGYGNGSFGPDDDITREQFIVMLWALAGFLKYGNNANVDLSGFKDASKISSWALKAMKWAYKKGIVSGNTNKQLLPKNLVTRAETATMVMKFRKG